MSISKQALIGGLSALLLACGGAGASRTPQAAVSPSTVRLSGKVAGTASAPTFASQPLLTSGATLTVDGSPSPSAQIQPGVVLQGTARRTDQGFQVVSADLEHELEGPIASLDLAGSSFVVLGKTVVVNALTVLVDEGAGGTQASLTLADFKVGDVVEVYGSAQADGSVLATRVERQPAGSAEMVEGFRGTVSALDATAKTFQADGFLVSYGTATVQGTLVDGARVEVRGTASGTAFTASFVAVLPADDQGTEVEVSGTLSGLDANAKTFQLMAYTVDYSGAQVEGTLADGATVEVEGTLSATGSSLLQAREVAVRLPEGGSGDSDLAVTGTVAAVDVGAGTLTVGATTFWTDSATLIVKGDTPATLADVTVGARVEIRALSTRTNAAGQPYATLVALGSE